jgi:hypothetical protein
VASLVLDFIREYVSKSGPHSFFDLGYLVEGAIQVRRESIIRLLLVEEVLKSPTRILYVRALRKLQADNLQRRVSYVHYQLLMQQQLLQISNLFDPPIA